jgi:hypothetical protein
VGCWDVNVDIAACFIAGYKSCVWWDDGGVGVQSVLRNVEIWFMTLTLVFGSVHLPAKGLEAC